jgi:hypothetical protein
MPDRARVGQDAAGQTILETWILGALDQTETLTPTALAAQLVIPRPMVIEALIGLAECGLIADASEDEPADDEPADEPSGLPRSIATMDRDWTMTNLVASIHAP